jgi:O-antigen polymerase
MTRLLVAPLLSLLFFAILTILYIDIVSPLYNYYGLYDLLHLGKLVIAACVVVAIAFLVPVKICKVSDFLMWILYLLAIVPCMVIYGCQDRSTSYAIMLAVCYVVVDLARRLRLQPPRPPLSLSEGQIVCCCVFAVIITTCLVIASGGLTYFNLDFSKVYDVRSDIAANVFGAHRGAVYDASFLGYLTTLAFDVCNVFLVAYFLSKGKHVAAIAFIVVQIAYFGMSSDKVYVYALIIPLYFWLLRRAARWLTTFLTSIILLGAIASLEYVQFDSYLLAGNIFVRVFYLPAILNFSYHDIFQQLGHVYLSDSRFNPFAHYEHSLAPAFIVGWTIWGDVSTNANAGFLATSYMHFGYPGMLIYSLLVGLLLSFVDAGAANRGDLYLRISIVVIPFFKLLTSADLTTSLLSHGVLASLILSWLYTNRPEQVHVARSGMGETMIAHGRNQI